MILDPDELFNFKSILSEITAHNWDLQPCVKIIGREKSGKSKIVAEYAQSLLPDNLVIQLDSRELKTEDQLINAAVSCADHEELRASRDQLKPTSAQITITGSLIVGSTIQMRQGLRRRSWLFPWRRPQQTVHPSRRSLIPTLIEDLENVKRLTWIIVDHFNGSNQLILHLVRQIAPRLSRRRGLRLVLVTVEQSLSGEDWPTVTGLNSRTMATYRVEALDAEALHSWAAKLGLTLDHEVANAIHALSDGLAGKSFELLRKLAVKDQYRSSQYRELTQ